MKYENWSLGYAIVKQYIRFVDWIIHKKTIRIGFENIPKNKPVVFAPNHQNALSDPMAILLHTPLQPVWLARADIFKKGVITLILRFLKVMPVYRIRDGKEQLSKNDKTFADSIKVLRKNKVLGLFPEAGHSGKRQMLAHKKAVPRIVFLAEEQAKNNLDIQIVPVGIYYSSYWKFNRSVIINFGEAIPANNYIDAYRKNQNTATLALRDEIRSGIEKLIININSKTYYEVFETIREIYGKHFLYRLGKKDSTINRFQSDRKLVKKLDAIESEHPDKAEKIAKLTKDYHKLLEKHKIKNWLTEVSDYSTLLIPLNKIVLLLGLPVFLFGLIFNALPFFLTDIFTRKKMKEQAFWSTFFLMSGILFFPLAYLLELWAMSSFLPGIGLKLLFLLCLPLSGKIAFMWYILLLKTIGRSRIFFMKLFSPRKWDALKNNKNALFEQLDNQILT